MPNFKAFTARSQGGTLISLITPCSICKAFDPLKVAQPPQLSHFNALWDTGATGTVISPKVVQALGLVPFKRTNAHHAGGQTKDVGVYAVNIYLPNQVSLSFRNVCEGQLHGVDILIGMDIISMGDFSISNLGGVTTFTFRIPSVAAPDFVQDYKDKKAEEDLYAATGRNDPCPCGSGKKYKFCHGGVKKPSP